MEFKLADGCTFHEFDNGLGKPEFVVSTPTGRQAKVGQLARSILERLDGKTPLEEIVEDLRARSVPVTVEQIRKLLQEQYAPLGILDDQCRDTPRQVAVATQKVGFPFLAAFDLVPQAVVAWCAQRLTPLFSPLVVVLTLLSSAAAHAALYSNHPLRNLSPGGLIWILTLLLASMLFHELGHATAVSRFGGTPGRIGLGLYLLMPTFFADVSQVWRFRRKQRVAVDLGGVYFQLMAQALFVLGGILFQRQEFLAVCFLIDVMILISVNPIFRFDGYWVLLDYLSVPKLQKVALRYTGDRIRKLWNRGLVPTPLPQLGSAAARLVFRIYAVLAALFLAVIFWLAYRYLSSLIFQVPVLLLQTWRGMLVSFDQGEILQFLNRLLISFFILAFPLSASVGVSLYFYGLVQMVVRKIRGGKPNSPVVKKGESVA